MAVKGENMHNRLREIQVRHWQRLAASAGPDAWRRMTAMVEGVDGMLVDLGERLPAGFPVKIWEAVSAGTRRHTSQFLRSVEALSRGRR